MAVYFYAGFLVVTFHQINVQLPRFLFVYWLPRGSWGLERRSLCSIRVVKPNSELVAMISDSISIASMSKSGYAVHYDIIEK